MENGKEVINFLDFIKGSKTNLNSDIKKEEFLIDKEEIVTEQNEELTIEDFDFFVDDDEKDNITEEKFDELKLEKLDKLIDEVNVLDKEVYKILEKVEIVEQVEPEIIDINEDNYYLIYKDKSENFSCEVMVEGANINDTQARLIIESEEWTIMFNGEIDSRGRCNIPMKKLNIFNEGTKGKIRLEVIVEGAIFTPWESDCIVKMSKKVSIKMNETNNNKKPLNRNTEVKVNIKK